MDTDKKELERVKEEAERLTPEQAKYYTKGYSEGVTWAMSVFREEFNRTRITDSSGGR